MSFEHIGDFRTLEDGYKGHFRVSAHTQRNEGLFKYIFNFHLIEYFGSPYCLFLETLLQNSPVVHFFESHRIALHCGTPKCAEKFNFTTRFGSLM